MVRIVRLSGSGILPQQRLPHGLHTYLGHDWPGQACILVVCRWKMDPGMMLPAASAAWPSHEHLATIGAGIMHACRCQT